MDRVARLAGEKFVALMHRLGAIAHRAFAEQLRLAEIRIPARSGDPASHHVGAARHQQGVVRGVVGSHDPQNLVADLGGAPLVGIEADDPFVEAYLDCAVRW